jgi:tetratricopeptide (TPR) repeat protein
MELGDFARAHEILDQILNQTPLSLAAHLQKGRTHRRQQARHAASEAFQKAIQLHPYSAQAKIELAVELRALGKPHSSLQLLLEILQSGAARFSILEQINEHFRISDDFESSIEICEIWSQNYPQHPLPIINKSRALLELGRLDEAFSTLERAARRLHQPPQIQAARVDGFRRMRDWRRAAVVLGERGPGASEHFLIWGKRIDLLIDQGLYSIAEERILQRNVSTLQEHSRIKMFRGKIAEARWQLEEAAGYFREALDINRNDAGAHSELSRLCLKVLDLDGCRLHLRRHKEILASENLLQGNSINVSQTHVGQLLDEFCLDRELLAKVIEARSHPDSIDRLMQLNREAPEHTPTAIMLLIALRQKGIFGPGTTTPIGSPIPRNIVQYWDLEEPPQEILKLMLTWRDLNPTFQYQRFNDQSAKEFIRENYQNDVYTAYCRAQEPAQRADIFRLAYLAKNGGVYADADDRCIDSLDNFIKSGVNFAAYQEDFGTIGNNFLCASASHPVIAHALKLATVAVNRGDSDFLWLATGPGLLTRSFAEFISSCGEDTSWQTCTAVFGMGELQRRVGIHCRVGYKRTTKHWSRTSFRRTRNPSIQLIQAQTLEAIRQT